MKKEITVVIVTFQTRKEILLKCLSSIQKGVKILIIENSKKLQIEIFLKINFKI